MKKLFVCLALASLFCLPNLLFAQSSSTQTETRNLTSFDKIANSGKLQVMLKKGNEESVKLEVKGIDLARVKTEVKDGTLKIYVNDKEYKKAYSGVLHVTYKNLEALTHAGSAGVYCRDILSGNEFSLTVAGSGNVDLDKVKFEDMTVTLSGSADVEVSGSADKAQFTLTGSGEIDADELLVEVVSANVSGSGNIETNANSSLHAISSGSGGIYYLGEPDNVQTKNTGSGTITKKKGF